MYIIKIIIHGVTYVRTYINLIYLQHSPVRSLSFEAIKQEFFPIYTEVLQLYKKLW